MNGDMFPPATPEEVTLEDKIKELERELRLRWSVYPRWVKAGKINQQTSDRQILIMQSVVNDYYEKRSGENDGKRD